MNADDGRLTAVHATANSDHVRDLLLQWTHTASPSSSGDDCERRGLHLLEVGSGTGQHAVDCASLLCGNGGRWLPTDPALDMRASIAAHTAAHVRSCHGSNTASNLATTTQRGECCCDTKCTGVCSATATDGCTCGCTCTIEEPVDFDIATSSLEDWQALLLADGDGEGFDAVLCVNTLHLAGESAVDGLLNGGQAVLRPGGVLIVHGPFSRLTGEREALEYCYDSDTDEALALGLQSLGKKLPNLEYFVERAITEFDYKVQCNSKAPRLEAHSCYDVVLESVCASENKSEVWKQRERTEGE